MRPVRLSTVLLMIFAAEAAAQDSPAPVQISAPQLPQVEVAIPAAALPLVLSLERLPEPALVLPERVVMQSSFAIGLEALPDAGDVDAALAHLRIHVASVPATPVPEAARVTERSPTLRFEFPAVEAPPQVAVIPPAAMPDAPAATPEIAKPPAVAVPTSDWRERFAQALPQVTAAAPQFTPQVFEAISQFYAGRDGRPVFVDGGAPTVAGRAVLTTVAHAEGHGLSPARFERLAALAGTGTTEVRELALAALAVAYARDARGARLDPQKVSRLITATPTMPEVDKVLEALVAVPTGDTLEGWNPRHEGYRALKAQLERLRSADHTASAGEKSRAALEGDIIANMERWRWLPTELGDSHVMVNVPSYRLEMVRGGNTVFETRVIVGKATSQTPIFSHVMEYLVVNPYWNVPPSIALKEYLPLLKANPYALQARGLEIVSRGRVVDPGSIDWNRMPRSIAIRQPPGERNALGNIKFIFPNDHAVYLHDTPSRGLFSASRRAFSHGCVRVQNPFALASAVSGWSEGRLRGMVGGAERRLDLPKDVQVHLAYFTLVADDDGKIIAHGDLYGHHGRMKRLMGL